MIAMRSSSIPVRAEISGQGEPVREAARRRRRATSTLAASSVLRCRSAKSRPTRPAGCWCSAASASPARLCPAIPSAPIRLRNSTTTSLNNDYWYDDISDGPVTATVTLPDGTQIKIDSAADAGWVIVAPPKYAPGVYPIVTLYDVIRDTAIRANWLKDDAQVEYYRDIYPILLKAGSMSCGRRHRPARSRHSTSSATTASGRTTDPNCASTTTCCARHRCRRPGRTPQPASTSSSGCAIRNPPRRSRR